MNWISRKNPGYGFNYLGIYNNRLLATQISNQDLIIERFSLTNETSTIYNPFLIPEPFTLISFLKNNVLLLGKSGLLHYINLATNVLNSIDVIYSLEFFKIKLKKFNREHNFLKLNLLNLYLMIM